MAQITQSSTGFNFNNIEEIKSHSTILANERLAILFYLLDMKSMSMNNNARVSDVIDVYSTSYQIYKNVRTLIRNNPTMRATLNLNTKNPGVYLTDFIYGRIDRMIQFCQEDGFTVKRLQIIINELNRVEMIIKDALQYYHYFYRPDFRQKPDVDIATEVYKEMADKKTVEDLRQIAGQNHMIDFENLGTSRIELTEELQYDEVVDGEMTEEDLKIIKGKKGII